jgi:hypothetical protein
VSTGKCFNFQNAVSLDLLVAGSKDKGTSWGEGVGYAFGHLTEVAAYGSAEGSQSLEVLRKRTRTDIVYLSQARRSVRPTGAPATSTA